MTDIPPFVTQFNQEHDPWKRAKLVEAIYQAGEQSQAIQLATQVLTADSFNNLDRQAMIQAVVRLKDPATAELLLQLFKKREAGVWNNALDGLKKFKYAPLVDELILQLKDGTPHTRAWAANALGDLGDVRAIEPLKALLDDKNIAWEGDRPGEPSMSVSQAAQEALKKLKADIPEEKKSRWKFW